jgi:hypothetical protein
MKMYQHRFTYWVWNTIDKGVPQFGSNSFPLRKKVLTNIDLRSVRFITAKEIKKANPKWPGMFVEIVGHEIIRKYQRTSRQPRS